MRLTGMALHEKKIRQMKFHKMSKFSSQNYRIYEYCVFFNCEADEKNIIRHMKKKLFST